MGLYTNGANSRTAAAVRDTERFVEIEMADISSNLTGRAKANLSVHICSIHVYLTTVLMDNIACGLDLRLKDTECAGICDHNRTKLLAVLLTLRLEIFHVEVS